MDASFFISDAPVAREVELADGSKHTLYFKQLPAGEFRKFFYAAASKDEAERSSATTRLLVAAVCEPDGKPAMTFKQADRLRPNVEKALFDAVLSVNGMGKEKEPGNSLPPGVTSGTGTSSPSPLAAEQ
jgi:hypothetical protein